MNTAKGQMSACVMVSRRPSTVYKRWASWAVRWRECSPWLLNSWLSVAFLSFSLLQLYSQIHSLIPIRTHYRPLVNRIRCAAGDVFTKGVFPKRSPSCRVSLSEISFLFAYLSVFSYPNNTVKCTEKEKKPTAVKMIKMRGDGKAGNDPRCESQWTMSPQIFRVNTMTLTEKNKEKVKHVSSFPTINVTRYFSLAEYRDIIDTSWKYFTTEIQIHF